MINATFADWSKAFLEIFLEKNMFPIESEVSNFSSIPKEYFKSSYLYDKGFTKITLEIKDMVGKCKTKEEAIKYLKEKIGISFEEEKCLDLLYYNIAFDEALGCLTGRSLV